MFCFVWLCILYRICVKFFVYATVTAMTASQISHLFWNCLLCLCHIWHLKINLSSHGSSHFITYTSTGKSRIVTMGIFRRLIRRFKTCPPREAETIVNMSCLFSYHKPNGDPVHLQNVLHVWALALSFWAGCCKILMCSFPTKIPQAAAGSLSCSLSHNDISTVNEL